MGEFRPLEAETCRDYGRTRLSQLVQCANEAERDLIINSGMETGVQDGMDLLEQVARSLQ